MPPLPSLQLRRLFLRSLSYFSSAPHLLRSSESFSVSTHFLHSHSHSHSHSSTTACKTSLFQSLLVSKPFSSSSENPPPPSQQQSSDDEIVLAQTLSSELLKDPNSDPLPVSQRLQLSFSHINPTPSLILSALNLSSEAGQTILDFNQWLISNPSFVHTDETLSFFVDYFGRRKDFKVTHDVILSGNGVAGPKTLFSAIDRLVRAGRENQAVSFFERMERDYGLKRDKLSLRIVVEKLCENGYARCAEKMVKNLAHDIFPDEYMCDLLVKGWCVDGKFDEAKRLVGEMYRGGFEIGTMAYNAMLDCICKLCRKKDPFRLQSEAEQVLVEMDIHGVPRNVETFNVLISNLCKIRKTGDALKLFDRMGEWGCFPNAETFLVLTNSLYQAARVGEGDEMIDRMKSSGYGNKLDKKAYYGFLKILCGIERVDHALNVFEDMKKHGCEPGIKTYDLLIGKLCSKNRVDKANSLFSEAVSRGVPVTPKAYKVDPRYLKKPKVVVKEKKRETLPEKMVRKRRRLKQIRLSFVKKPKKMMGR